MFDPAAFSPERQAQIAKMADYDREQQRLAKYDPENQEEGEILMFSEHFRHNFNYTKRKMTKKLTNQDKESKFFLESDLNHQKLLDGEIFKTIVSKGESYRTSSMNDRVSIKLDLQVIDGQYPLDPVTMKDSEPEIEECSEEESKAIDVAEEETEKILFREENFELEYYLFDETTFLGLDALISKMNRKEKAEAKIYGIFLVNFFGFLKNYSKEKEEEIENLEKLFASRPYETTLKSGLMVKVLVEVVDSTKILDITNDGGVLKERKIEAKNFEGLGWPSKDDHVVVSVKILKGHKSGEEVDYGDISMIWKQWSPTVTKKLSKGFLLALQEVKKSETSWIRILPKSVNERYAEFASDKFREANELTDEELVYEVTTKSVQKVFSLKDGDIKYRVLSKGVEGDVKTPRVMQTVSFKMRWFINKYEVVQTEGIPGEESVTEKILKERTFFVGMGCADEGEEEELKPTSNYNSLAFTKILTGQLPNFVECAVRKLNRDKHVVITTSKKELVFDHPELDLVIDRMLLDDLQGSENMNITGGKMHEKLLEFNNGNKSLEEQHEELKNYFLSFSESAENEEIEMEVDFLISYFESKDTYWDVEPSSRRVLMAAYKNQGNEFFKRGCFEQAAECYRAGARVYSNHNFNMIDKAEVKKLVKHLKVSCLLNLATACSKFDDKKSIKKAFEEAEDLTKNDPLNLKIVLKKASVNMNLNNLPKARELLMKVREHDQSFPGLRAEFQRYKNILQESKLKQKKTYKGFLTKEENKDLLASKESRSKPKPTKLDLSNVDKKDWEKKAKEFYGIE